MEIENKKNKTDAFGLVSMICGSLSLLCAFVPCIGVFALPMALVAVVFGTISIVNAKRDGNKFGMALSGVITSVISIIISILWIILITFFANNDFHGDIKNITIESFEYSGTVDNGSYVDFDKQDTTLNRLKLQLEAMDSTINESIDY